MKLIPMTDFVLEQFKQRTSLGLQSDAKAGIEDLDVIVRYAQFLKQPIRLDMFVPVDEDGKPIILEKGRDKEYDSSDTSPESIMYHTDWHNRRDKYIQAKEKVLFKDISVNQRTFYLTAFSTVEDLTRVTNTLSHIEITPTAIKQIGL